MGKRRKTHKALCVCLTEHDNHLSQEHQTVTVSVGLSVCNQVELMLFSGLKHTVQPQPQFSLFFSQRSKESRKFRMTPQTRTDVGLLRKETRGSQRGLYQGLLLDTGGWSAGIRSMTQPYPNSQRWLATWPPKRVVFLNLSSKGLVNLLPRHEFAVRW